MTTAIIDLLDKELPQLRGTERDQLAAKIVALVEKLKRKRGRK